MKVERYGIALTCEGMGDCLYAIPVIRKLHAATRATRVYDIFTKQPGLFESCPYVDRVYPFADGPLIQDYYRNNRLVQLFDLKKFEHWALDTTDFISLPTGMGQLSFREKQLEYFPTEPDRAEAFDVVLNTSRTWPSRSWPLAHWQRLADELSARGLSVAVVGKDVSSTSDGLSKQSPPLQGCRNLVNALSLDQTYYTIGKCRLFVSNQNGLSVLAGTTDVDMVVLDMSIEWSKRALYRQENPLHKFELVKGDCTIYCCSSDTCPEPSHKGEFKCVPPYDRVRASVFRKLGLTGPAT
ncbi:glycosyltransferase family 9 protein [Bordetella sp. N]|uniref:glycosyltransferase family 9 protein n=1 Tax=Bordetella sp. N TaxID=1746199 RepID=UPI00070C3FEC|nr:glycosyltransferase family 9 protein [Bordetella sp. N]ALM86153.1 hypothetical protein ASB57_27230 [Bordetella sp. N]